MSNDAQALRAPLPEKMALSVDRVLDAAVDEPKRIQLAYSAWRSLEASHHAELGRLLAKALQEPTCWLGLELRMLLATMNADVAFGVDAHGLLRCSDEPWSSLVADADGKRYDQHGFLVPLDQLEQLEPMLVDVLPWLTGPGPAPTDTMAFSYYLGAPGTFVLHTRREITDHIAGGGFLRLEAAIGEVIDVPDGRMVYLGEGNLGIHLVRTGRVVVVDNRERGLSGVSGGKYHARFPGFQLQLQNGAFRFLSGKYAR